jgi:hypothetical protein
MSHIEWHQDFRSWSSGWLGSEVRVPISGCPHLEEQHLWTKRLVKAHSTPIDLYSMTVHHSGSSDFLSGHRVQARTRNFSEGHSLVIYRIFKELVPWCKAILDELIVVEISGLSRPVRLRPMFESQSGRYCFIATRSDIFAFTELLQD